MRHKGRWANYPLWGDHTILFRLNQDQVIFSYPTFTFKDTETILDVSVSAEILEIINRDISKRYTYSYSYS